MSQNRPPGAGMSGADTTQTSAQVVRTSDSPVENVEERRAKPTGGSPDAKQLIPTPSSLPSARSNAVAVVDPNASLADLADDGTGEADAMEKGYGPKVVILHDGVSGPSRRMFPKGKVVALSLIMGDDLMGKPSHLARQVRRYTEGENPAFREATKEESKYEQVTFAEGEEALAKALTDEQQRVMQAESEADRLRRIIDENNIDPQTGQKREAPSTPTSTNAPGLPTAASSPGLPSTPPTPPVAARPTPPTPAVSSSRPAPAATTTPTPPTPPATTTGGAGAEAEGTTEPETQF